MGAVSKNPVFLKAIVALNPYAFHPILDRLENDREWVTGDGRTLKLEDMEPSHRANTLAWLERRLPFIWRCHVDTEIVRLFLGPEPHTDAGMDGMDESLRDLTEEQSGVLLRPEEAKEWFETQPLVKRLRALAGGE